MIVTPSRITSSVSDRICRIVLNRPEKRNALDDIMVEELTAAFRRAGEDPSVRVVTLAAEGKAFCAGADLAYLQKLSSFSLEENQEDSARLAFLFETIYLLPKPVIAVVNGPALAGGCGLASVCDIVLASAEHALFGYTEVRIGFIPAVVMTFLVRRVGEGRAREMILRGNTFSAEEAERSGLVNRVLPEASLKEEAERLCRELATANSGAAMGLSKQLLGELSSPEVGVALRTASRANADARMTEDCRKGIAAFLEKQRIEW